MNWDVIIIGGGAAGLMCAAVAGGRGRRVLLVEHAASVGKKIAISGGGRCNFTNLYTTPDNFISANPNFCKSALARYTPQDFVALVERHGIPYHEKKFGQLFCDGSAREIIRLLLDECKAATGQGGAVEVRLGCQVRQITRADHFAVETSQGTFTAGVLVVATGGLSIPPIGATDFGYRLAQHFGLRLRETRPALVPLTFAEAERAAFTELSGVSFDATARVGATEFQESVLFTHRGLSGPAILQISSYWKRGAALEFDLLPGLDARELLMHERRKHPELELKNLLARHLPRRFAQTWCELQPAGSRPLALYAEKELDRLAQTLHHWPLRPDGSEGYKKAEVTAGGVDTDELNARTMEARRVPGLYFIGEVLDVTGHLGGFNFQWAWASGHAAGQSL